MDDLYMPSVKSERVGDVIVAIDTSGSIGQGYLNEFFSYLSTLCEQTTPESVTVLWWDTEVRSKQVLTDNYDNLKTLLKPRGGGGTSVSCVSKYIIDNKINGECLIVLTDGYVEDNIKWATKIPTLWLSTQVTNFKIPSGTLVSIK
jgi:predicted metal-dependent peptidase